MMDLYVYSLNCAQSIKHTKLKASRYLTKIGAGKRSVKAVFRDEPVYIGSRRYLTKTILEMIDRLRPGDIVFVDKYKDLERADLDINPMISIIQIGARITDGFIPKRKYKADKRKSKSLTKRLLDGRINSVRQGRKSSGVTPIGYRSEFCDKEGRFVLKVHEEESLIVKDIFKRYIKGQSLGFIAKSLNAEGIRTRRGKNWSRSGISWIIKNKTYVGRVTFGDVSSKGLHEPLISWIEYNKAQLMLDKNDRTGRRKTNKEKACA